MKEIAPARTFGFLHEAEMMRQQGLIRGASDDNAMVLTRDGAGQPAVRFPDEFVRHKILDLIGDLALIGRRILGNVVADRAGHAMHTALAFETIARSIFVGRSDGHGRELESPAQPERPSAPLS